MQRLKISLVTKKDAENIYHMMLHLLSEGKKFYPFVTLTNKKKKHLLSVIRKSIENKNNRYLIAKIGRKVIGYTIGVILKTEEEFFDYHNFLKYDKYGYVNDIFVAKKFRKRGIAKKLLENLLGWFKKNDVKYIELHTLAKNKVAIRFFKHMKFVEYEKMMHEIMK